MSDKLEKSVIICLFPPTVLLHVRFNHSPETSSFNARARH